MHNHRTTYAFGDIVYLKTDHAQLARMVIAVTLRPNGSQFYELGCGAESSFHFDIEMASQVDVNMKMGIECEK